MEILVMTQYFYPETFRVNDFCADLAERGHSVTVLTGYPQYPIGRIYDGYGYSKPYERVWRGVKVERVKAKPRGKTPLGLLNNCISYVVEANKWVKKCEKKFDLVYVFEVSPVTVGLPAVTYKNKFNTPIAFNVQDLWPENIESVLGIHFKPLIKTIDYIVDKIYKNSDFILCSSKSFCENIKNRGTDGKKLYFWPQFCNAPDFSGMQKPKEYGDDCLNIVFSGNLGFAQGLDLLISAAEELKDEKVRWYLVGDGRARESLEKRVKESNLEEKVIFVGRVSEEKSNEYVHFADCAYLSFKDDKLFDMTIPAKLQSYLACKTPVIAAAGGESADIIGKAFCGYTANRDKKSVADAVLKMMKQPKSVSEKMRENAGRYFDENFEKTKVIDRFEEITMKDKNLKTKAGINYV